ncbi:MAG: dTDP-4-dehydrorhamnose 3,5-epimerase [Clostridiales bacterium]|nr:dTDP-4-dehydrorhamnose 3,5-epimerase [Clostridiales bacterium]
MDHFQFIGTDMPGVSIINSFLQEDNRGMFVKSFEKDIFRDNGIDFSCNELFFSYSTKHVIRGLHFQTHAPQAKLVGVISGRVFDVVVDLRAESPTFGQWRGFYLSAVNRNSLLIPRGCAHGFIALQDESIVSYLGDGPYDKATDTGIRYNDPEIGIRWPINNLNDAIVSEKDQQLMSFGEFRKQYRFEV